MHHLHGNVRFHSKLKLALKYTTLVMKQGELLHRLHAKKWKLFLKGKKNFGEN